MIHEHADVKALCDPCVALLKTCAYEKDLQKGTRVHAEIVRRRLLDKSPRVASALVSMYAKCGALAKAQQVLNELRLRDVITWNALISAYVQQDKGEEALKCFQQMQREGFCPNEVTFLCIVKACGITQDTCKGEQIHDKIISQGLLGGNLVLGNALVYMYIRCGALKKAQQVLDELPARDVVSWSTLIVGYTEHGQGDEALSCFGRMHSEGLIPDAISFICILKACGSMGAIEHGKHVHDEIVRQGLLVKNTALGNALVDMYIKCSTLTKAQATLDGLSVRSVVSWSAMIAGYAQQGLGKEALMCFERMQMEGFYPNEFTFACALKACGNIGAIEKAKKIHKKVVNQALLLKDTVLGNALIDTYTRCGAHLEAQQVLDELPIRDAVSWNAVMTGYAQQGKGDEALTCYQQMQYEGLSPDTITLVCILKGCGSIGAADKGKEIHAEIINVGLLRTGTVLGNALVDMYAKCALLTEARWVFDELNARDIISWGALIAGYAKHGQGVIALESFQQMQCEGLSPNAVIFTSVLNACSSSCLVDEGQLCLTDMNSKYGIVPSVEHYTCIVDLFGRCGYLDKAIEVIKQVEICDSLPIWYVVLGACEKWSNVQLGRWAFEQAVQIDNDGAKAYIHMANIFAAAGMHKNAEYIQAMRFQ